MAFLEHLVSPQCWVSKESILCVTLSFSRGKNKLKAVYLSDPGIKPGSPALHTDSLPSQPPGKPINNSGFTHGQNFWLVILLL